jgi:hypothetical protein
MRLSDERINQLQNLLNEQFGLVYTDEEAHEAALAIARFIVAKARRADQQSTNIEEENDG